MNVVSTVDLKQRIDLLTLKQFEFIIHNSKIYRGNVAYLKTPHMEGKVSIFPSGKMISVGTRSPKKAFSELVNAKNFLVKKEIIKPIQIQPRLNNVVVKVDLNMSIDLEDLAVNIDDMIYEPDQFPAGILKIKEPMKATSLVFSSGKLIITGFKEISKIEPLIKKLAHILSS